MEEKIYTGTISFVHHQKHYATIDYTESGKKKTINFQTNIKDTLLSGVSSRNKKHHFRSGDTVNFNIGLTPRGDRMNAYDVKYLYNNELDRLLQKANTDNHFKGFLKVADETYFVKELQSYLFFPLVFSPWQRKPTKASFNEAFEFRLININKQNISAELLQPDYITPFKNASKWYKTKTPVEGTIAKISPYGVYVNLGSELLQAKLILSEEEAKKLQTGDNIKVLITYLTNSKIAIEKA
jgi:ribosomal protein S1